MTVLLLTLCGFSSLAQTAPAPVVAEKHFTVATDGEVGVRITARAPGTSWGIEGAEAAILTCRLDGQYSQDLILFLGAQKFTYTAMLGRLAAGSHVLSLELNRRFSASGAAAVDVIRIEINSLDKLPDADEAAFAHAPVLFARRNSIGRFTDIPLLMWYELFRDQETIAIRYSFVFTNEDGGTATEALMARWGRATDIEWAYEVKLRGGEILEEIFQAVNHKATPFRGKKLAGHPLILVASDNNNFSDAGESEMRFALWPEPMDLSRHSREELMDRHPWTYRLMAQELMREGKISEAGGHMIRDPREYVYIEANAPRENMGIDLIVGMRDGKWFDSDLDRDDLRITRSGWFRVAVRLPEGEAASTARSLKLDCKYRKDPVDCSGVGIQKVFKLDRNYKPRPLRLRPAPAQQEAASR